MSRSEDFSISGMCSILNPGAARSSGVPVHLVYRTAMPYAVELHIHAYAVEESAGRPVDPDDRHAVVWMFSRDLLMASLSVQEGEVYGVGDVRVSRDGDDVVIILTNGKSSAQVLLARRLVSDFVVASTRVVPVGSERMVLTDADLEALLSQ